MKWFKDGLNKDELKQAYRNLAKQWHPDLIGGKDSSWNGFHSGLAYCEAFDNPNECLEKEVHRLEATFELPTFKDIYTMPNFRLSAFSVEFCLKNYSNKLIHHIRTQFGEHVVYGLDKGGKSNPYTKTLEMIVKCNGAMYLASVKPSYLGPIEILGEYNVADMFFTDCTGYTAVEFFERYDIEYYPRFSGALSLTKCDPHSISNPTIGYFMRRKLISVYQAKTNYKMRFGTFNLNELLRYLPTISVLTDIDEVQDYLDELNLAFDTQVRQMVKSGGKIKIKI